MDNGSAAQPGIDVGRYWSVLVARWRVALAGTLVGIGAAGAYLVLTPPSYIASTTLAVFPITTDPYAGNRNTSNLTDMNAEAVRASSFLVAELAAESLGGTWSASELRQQTRVSTGSDSTTMTITVNGPSEDLARMGAAAMAESFIRSRSDQAKSSIDDTVTRDRERIDALRQSLTAAFARLAESAPGSLSAAEASADQQLLNLQISALLSRISSLEGIDTTGGVILNPASRTTITVQPSRSAVLATGAAAGLGLGIIAAFVTHSRQKVLRASRDLERELEIDVIGDWVHVADLDDAAAIAAQRILRQAALYGADSVALLFDDHVTDSERIEYQLENALGASVSSDTDEMWPRITSVDPGTAEGARLEALRTSDAAVLVVAARGSKMSAVSRLVHEAREMGTGLIGAIIVPASGLPAMDEEVTARRWQRRAE